MSTLRLKVDTTRKPMTREISEKQFLKEYDAKAFPSPLLTVDAALFTFHENEIKVLLVRRGVHPERGKWALPGGFVLSEEDASLEAAVRRVLRDKTGVNPPYLEQLVSTGNQTRDKRGWSVSVCYSALIAHQDCAPHIQGVTDTQWASLDELNQSKLAFDHEELIDSARSRLRQKALYSIVPARALGKEFTFPELQALHEALVGKPIQKRSFRRRIEQAKLLIDTGKKRSEGHRPASLYKLSPKADQHTFIRNLEG